MGVRETTVQEAVREAVDVASGPLADAAGKRRLPAWLLPWLVELERRQVGRFGPAGITTQVASAIENAALGATPAGLGERGAPLAPGGAPRVLLRELHLVNFRQFAKARLVFPEGSSRPVTLVEAPNGFGKSHLIEALRFVLVDYLGRPGPGSRASFESLLHRYVEGDQPRLEVHIALDVDGEPVLVWRRLVFRRSGSGFVAEGRPGLTVRLPGKLNPLQDMEAADWLSHRLPPEIVGYFVFDAESQVVQELSGQSGERLPEVKGQVEAAIGVRPLRDAARRVRERETVLRAELAGLRDEPTPESVDARIAALGAERETIEADREAARARARAARARIDEIERLIGAVTRPPPVEDEGVPPGDGPRLAELQAKAGHLRGLAVAAVQEDLPLALLLPLLQEAGTRRPGGAVEDTPAVRRALDVISEAASSGSFPWARPETAERIRADLATALGLGDVLDEALVDLARRSEAARRRLDDAGLARLAEIQAEVDEMERRARARPRPPSPDGAAGLRALIEERDRRLEDERRSVDEEEREGRRLDDLDAELRGLAPQRGRSRDAARRRATIEKQAVVARTAAEALDEAADALRQHCLRTLQRAASTALHRTTNKPDLFQGVEFDADTLRYRVVDPDGRPVPPDRSTGERTVLALALVTGLQRASGLEFPLVMEAPLKPLDPVHQARVVSELLSRRGHQTILLVKPGEIPDHLFGVVSAQVGQRLSLRRPRDHQDVTEVVAEGGSP